MQRVIDRERCEGRDLAARGWAALKAFRRVATRYEKTARNYLAFLHLTAATVVLR